MPHYIFSQGKVRVATGPHHGSKDKGPSPLVVVLFVGQSQLSQAQKRAQAQEGEIPQSPDSTAGG